MCCVCVCVCDRSALHWAYASINCWLSCHFICSSVRKKRTQTEIKHYKQHMLMLWHRIANAHQHQWSASAVFCCCCCCSSLVLLASFFFGLQSSPATRDEVCESQCITTLQHTSHFQMVGFCVFLRYVANVFFAFCKCRLPQMTIIVQHF